MRLEDRKWREFFIKDLFFVENKKKIQVPTGAYISKKDLINGHIPRITVTSENNGIDNFYVSDHKNFRTYKNFISVSFLGTVFYHPYKASLDMKVHSLLLKRKPLNKLIGALLVTSIKKSVADASYGNQISSTDLPHKKILLPVNNKGELDFAFMQAYVQKIFEKKEKKYRTYIKKVLQELEYKKIEPLEEKKWNAFELTKIFDKFEQGKSKGLNHLQVTPNGEINYLGAKKSNNGVLAFVEKNDNSEKLIQKGNCIAFIRNGDGSAGYSVYKSESFIATSDITVGYSKKLNKYVGLFITTISDKYKSKYGFGYKRSNTRLKKEKILLPVNNKGEPDYKYMEQYIKNIMYKKIKQYLDFKVRHSS